MRKSFWNSGVASCPAIVVLEEQGRWWPWLLIKLAEDVDLCCAPSVHVGKVRFAERGLDT